ncbi:MAG: hypothetical protein WKF74_02970 [Pyrinomonadaceae bacterium]
MNEKRFWKSCTNSKQQGVSRKLKGEEYRAKSKSKSYIRQIGFKGADKEDAPSGNAPSNKSLEGTAG